MKNYDKQERVLGPAKIKRTRKQAFTIKKIGNGDIRERKWDKKWLMTPVDAKGWKIFVEATRGKHLLIGKMCFTAG